MSIESYGSNKEILQQILDFNRFRYYFLHKEYIYLWGLMHHEIRQIKYNDPDFNFKLEKWTGKLKLPNTITRKLKSKVTPTKVALSNQ